MAAHKDGHGPYLLEIIKSNGLKHDVVMNAMGLRRATYYRRLQEPKLSPELMVKFYNVLKRYIPDLQPFSFDYPDLSTIEAQVEIDQNQEITLVVKLDGRPETEQYYFNLIRSISEGIRGGIYTDSNTETV